MARHWAERYVGRPYGPDHDCWDLVRTVLAEQFAVTVPDWRPHGTGLAAAARIRALRGTLAARTDAPRDGDGVLMHPLGARRAWAHHIGVWCEAGEPCVLHCRAGGGTCLHPLRVLAAHGLSVEGTYRWIVR